MVFVIIMYRCSSTASYSKIYKFEEFLWNNIIYVYDDIYIYIICNSKCYDPKNFEKCYFIKKIKTNAAKVVCLYVFFLNIYYRNGLEIIVYTLVTVILAKMIGKKKMENL